MHRGNDLECIKNELEEKIGERVIIKSHNKVRGKERDKIYTIEGVYCNIVALKREINPNIGVIESYTFVELLNKEVEIISML
ncbi:Veg family protein [Clostridium baratii]|uniref:Veg family protein n=1 Tax=Clostridium baratii TaxID=1561 RepID=UPI0030D2E042